ncbi:MAG: hypothetical protein Q4A31_00715 [Corynebacterium sp.]|uniref:hypothetical protein n=1 Tax=Corynebacterium sp. TaxID=1720 RepID=UPI0026DD1941|nr:hypothetical protein [Corynebacterium sp.]MDO4760430.1 hypothetical protein [Corynebacterium sp.]
MTLRLFSTIALTVSIAASIAHPTLAQEAASQCPKVTIVAARGSEQNSNLIPTRYSEQAPASFGSNGFEGENIRGMLKHAEARYAQLHPGESLLKDVDIIGLDHSVYPALLPVPELAKQGEVLSLWETFTRALKILWQTPLFSIIDHAVRNLYESILTGIGHTPEFLARYEHETGCQPDYIFTGYSQGAIILSTHERYFAQRGKLRGVVYLGNPYMRIEDHAQHVFGNPLYGIGMLSAVPLQRGTVPRINYCLANDFTCDSSLRGMLKSSGTGGGTHPTYFMPEHSRHSDDELVDLLAQWINK